MKAPPFFMLGTVFLGVATSALGFLRGTSAEQEAGGGEERFGRHHPRHTFYCEHSATGDSVDQVVHVMAGKSLTLWSHGVLSTSNVHFVVHKDATLILESKEGIDLRRHESSSRALIMVAGKVVINWPTRLVSLFDEAAINYAYVWKMTRLPVQDVDVHEPINSSTMPTSTTSTISTPNDWDDNEEDVFGEDGESAVVDEATCSPAPTTPTTDRDDTAVPFPPRNESPEGDVTEQLVCDDLKGENEGEEENEVEKENGGEEEEKNEKDEKEDEEEKEGEESQEEQDGEVRRCEEHVVSPLCVYDVLLRGKVTSASGRPEVCPATDEADAPLKVGDVLRGKLVSASRNSAVWPAADGALMFGRFVPSDKNEDVHIFDEHGGPREATGMAKVQVLLGVNGRQLRKAMSLRRRVEEEKGNGKGTEEGTEDAKGESFFGWLPWSGRAQRELQTARENAGQVDVSVNNKACIKVTVDGTPVLARSGRFQWEFMNRVLQRRPRDAGYEVHLADDDAGLEVQLRGRYVWGIRVGDEGMGKQAGGLNAGGDHAEGDGRGGRTIWGVSASDWMGDL
eukprot:jgi/Undpi1/13788/HiC_scaffold_9.g03439.m1